MMQRIRNFSLPNLSDIGRFLLTLFALALGGLTVWHGWQGEAALVATCGALCILAILAANLHLLESFSGFGIKAQTRAIKQKLDEADEILRKLRRIAELTGQSIVTHQSSLGRSGVQTVAGNYAMAGQIRAMLVEVGSSAEAVYAALEPWASWIIRDIAYGYFQRLRVALTIAENRLSKDGQERSAAAKFMSERLANAYKLPAALFPASWEDIIRDMPFLTDEERHTLQQEAAELRPVIDGIRRRQEIISPEKWIPRIQHICRTRDRSDGPVDWTLDGWSRPDPRFKGIL